ncbi:MAG: hypothetical protein NTV46_03720 [Verrucomicrobia bacterium]|nr:hypothetical protein [Verrucomicrobiota bacterium]
MKHPAIMKEPSPPILVSWPVAIVVVAVVYAMVAKAAIHVAVLPSNISPVFPDVGIALAAVLIFGRIALFGVWLGSFAINVISFFQDWLRHHRFCQLRIIPGASFLQG